MKFQLCFTDPEGMDKTLDSEVVRSLEGIPIEDKEERDALAAVRKRKLETFAKQWAGRKSEMVVEFDTDKGTAIVLERTDSLS
jgi:hypothetical protein